MKKMYSQRHLFEMDAVEIYKMVLIGDIVKRFPKGFWQRPEAEQNAIKCTRFLIEDVLKYDDKKIKKFVNNKTFRDNKLGGMLNTCFHNSTFEAINLSYPDRIKPWQFNVPRGYWNIKTCKEAITWLIEEKLQWSDKDITAKLSRQVFIDNDLGGMLSNFFRNSPYAAIDFAYKGRFRPWEFSITPLRYWTKERGINATRWLIEEKLKLSDEDIKICLSEKLFIDNGLRGMLRICFEGSPFKAVNAAYYGKYKPWEFSIVPQGFWTKEHGVEATKWLIEEKLKLSDDELKEQLSKMLFYNNGLTGMLQHCFGSSPLLAIISTYPDRFNKEDFKIRTRLRTLD